jgi:hypothetical protein
MGKDDDDFLTIQSQKLSLCYNFTECNNDYDNDDTIILASAITLDDELYEEKKEDHNTINRTSDLNLTIFSF